jgi:HSP20 family molecular chaperone IbpA
MSWEKINAVDVLRKGILYVMPVEVLQVFGDEEKVGEIIERYKRDILKSQEELVMLQIDLDGLEIDGDFESEERVTRKDFIMQIEERLEELDRMKNDVEGFVNVGFERLTEIVNEIIRLSSSESDKVSVSESEERSVGEKLNEISSFTTSESKEMDVDSERQIVDSISNSNSEADTLSMSEAEEMSLVTENSSLSSESDENSLGIFEKKALEMEPNLSSLSSLSSLSTSESEDMNMDSENPNEEDQSIPTLVQAEYLNNHHQGDLESPESREIPVEIVRDVLESKSAEIFSLLISLLRESRISIVFQPNNVEDKYVLTASIPDLDLSSTNVKFGANNSIIITGHRFPPRDAIYDVIKKIDDDRDYTLNYLLRICTGRYGYFIESFQLPPNADRENITAEHEGITLFITIPKKQLKNKVLHSPIVNHYHRRVPFF